MEKGARAGDARKPAVIFEDTVVLDAPTPEVWNFLLDVDRSAACVPGVEHVTLVDDRTFDGTIEARVGPISGRFSFRARIIESDPPRELQAAIEGTDSVTKSTLRMDIVLNLEALGATRTALGYRAVVDIDGRLAILGDMILRATAVLILEEFTRRLRTQLAASGTAAERRGGAD
ncbi:MAG: hypothetical protein GEU73_11495 [Chloroflexi bacterium]|nr:hypothetical protein [Chloroflexota bacterium]